MPEHKVTDQTRYLSTAATNQKLHGTEDENHALSTIPALSGMASHILLQSPVGKGN